MVKKLRGYLITGILVITPIALTFYIFWKLFSGLDGILLSTFNNIAILFGLPAYQGHIPGLGIIAMGIVTILTGIAVRNYFGHKLFRLGEFMVTKIPLISKIYIALRQIFEAIFAEKREVFKEAVLFQYPRLGMYSIGFITQDTRGEIQDIINDDVYSIFLPTTPNPTSGYLLFIPKKDVTKLTISVEEALKLIISGGAITPESVQGNKISLDDLIPFKKWQKKKKHVELKHSDVSES